MNRGAPSWVNRRSPTSGLKHVTVSTSEPDRLSHPGMDDIAAPGKQSWQRNEAGGAGGLPDHSWPKAIWKLKTDNDAWTVHDGAALMSDVREGAREQTARALLVDSFAWAPLSFAARVLRSWREPPEGIQSSTPAPLLCCPPLLHFFAPLPCSPPATIAYYHCADGTTRLPPRTSTTRAAGRHRAHRQAHNGRGDGDGAPGFLSRRRSRCGR